MLYLADNKTKFITMKNLKRISKERLKSINGGRGCPPGFRDCPMPWGDDKVCIPHDNQMACPDL